MTSGQVSRKYSSGSLVKGALNAAVDAAGRHLAKELAPRRVNVISPGVVDTNLWGEPGSAARDALITRISAALPVGPIGRPEELARVYLMLMTNGFITGSVLFGGRRSRKFADSIRKNRHSPPLFVIRRDRLPNRLGRQFTGFFPTMTVLV